VAQVGRISGPLLEANLERNGIDLTFRNDFDSTKLLFLDVNNGKISINRDFAAADLDVTDTTIQTVNLIADTVPVANYTISENTIEVQSGDIFLNASRAIVLSNLETEKFFASDNFIKSKDNADIELRPNGTGTLEILNDLKVYGSLHATGNITLDGSITFGDTLIEDTVTFEADVNSDIIPAETDSYSLGRNQKRWDQLFTQAVNGEALTAGAAAISGIDLVKSTEYTIYVATNGSNTNRGDHIQGPVATIQEAISRIPSNNTDFYTIYVFPGTYQEQLPIVVPKFVTVAGNDIRNTIVKPASSNNTKDVFHLSGDSTIQNLTVKDFYYDEDNNTGYAFRFTPNTTITARSPYVQNVSVITKGSTVGVEDPNGFVIGDAGRGAWIDGSEVGENSREASMLFHSCTFITPNADAITMSNGVRVEWLNSFTYFANRGLYAFNGNEGRISQDGSTRIYGAELRSIGSASVYGNFGAVADGDETLMYLIKHNFGYVGSGKDSSNDKTLAIEENQVVKINSGRIFYQTTDHAGKFKVGDTFFVDFENGSTSIDIASLSTNSVTGLIVKTDSSETILSAEKVETGNIRFTTNRLDSLVGDLNLVSASEITNINSNTSIQRNLTIRDNFSFGGSLNLKGNEFSDKLQFNVEFDQNFNPNQTLTFTLGSEENYWKKSNLNTLELTSLEFINNFITSTPSNSNLELRASGTGKILIPDNDVLIENNLVVNADYSVSNVVINGNLTLTGNIFSENIVAADDFTINQNLTVGAAAQFEEILIDDNFITTTTSNTDLELRANGTGKILIPNNDVNLETNLYVSETIIDNLSNTFVISSVNFPRAIVSSNLTFENNVINSANSDLELRANSTGNVVISNDFEITNNVSMMSTFSVDGRFEDQGFGPELVNNGTFDNNFSGWTASGGGVLQWDPAGYLIVNGLSGVQLASQNVPVVAGRKYKVTATLIRKDSEQVNSEYSLRFFQSGVGDLAAWFKPGNLTDVDTPVTLTQTVTAVTNTLSIILRAVNVAAVWDDVSVVEDLGIIEFINPIELNIDGSLTHTGNINRVGNTNLAGDAVVDGLATITDFLSTNYEIKSNVLRNKETGLILNRSDPQNPFGFYRMTIAMLNGATADDFDNQTEKNLINFLANGTNPPYGFSYADANQNGALTTADTISWLQFIANSTTNNVTIDAFLKIITDEVIELEYENPGTFNTTLFAGNYTNPNIDFRASGTGTIYFSNNNVDISNNLSANDISSNNFIALNRITSDKFRVTDNIIEIYDNVVTTAISNENLELKANGKVSIPSNNIILTENLIVNGLTSFKPVTVSGTLLHTGYNTQTGDFTLDGNLTTNSLKSSGKINFANIRIADNTITTTDSNSDLELVANSAGKISVPNNNVVFNNNLTANNVDTTIANVNNLLEFNSATINNTIEIFNNVISIKNLNLDLILEKPNNKSVILESLDFSNSTVKNNSSSIDVSVTDNLIISANGSLRIPVGTVDQRTNVLGSIRFNTSDQLFEGRSQSNIAFNGIYSTNKATNIVAHPVDNIISLTVNNTIVGNISATGLTTNRARAGNISLETNRIVSTVLNSDLVLQTLGSGELQIGSISIVGSTIKNNNEGSLIVRLERYGYAKLGTTGAVAFPKGTVAERPTSPELGTTRWNTEDEILETWDGNTFIQSVGTSEVISEQEFSDLLLEYTLIFG